MPNTTSSNNENPLMFSFPPEELRISKIEIINQVPSYNVIRLAQSLVRKGTIHMGSLSQFNWWDLGLQVGVCFNSLTPNVSFLLGPLYTKYTPKKREKVMKHKKKTEEESKNKWEEEQPEDVASRIHKQGQETSNINGTLQPTISQVNARVDASKIDGEKMEIRDMVGGSNTLETRWRSGRNRRR
jgi:hypothetical protein